MATMSKTVAEIKNPKDYPRMGLSPILDPKARLAALRQIRGIWKNRTPDPIKELAKMQKEYSGRFNLPCGRVEPWKRLNLPMR